MISCSNSQPLISEDREVHYTVNKEASSKSLEAIEWAFSKWTDITGIVFLYNGSGPTIAQRDGINAIAFLTKWPDDIPQKTAWCNTWQNVNGEICEADILLNMELVRFSNRLSTSTETYCIESVMMHEIGHLLGLKHSTIEKSIMNPDLTYWRKSPPREIKLQDPKIFGENYQSWINILDEK